MKTMICFIVVTLMLSACETDDGVGVIGSPADVRAKLGVHDGYLLTKDCTHASRNFGIVGLGTNWFEGVAPQVTQARANTMDRLAHQVIEPALSNINSRLAVGWGVACQSNVGVQVHTNAWTDVDHIVDVIGNLLKERGLREEVAISVMPPPVVN